MQLPREEIERFQRIYAAETGEQLSFDQAEEMANRIIRFLRIVGRPLPNGPSIKHALPPGRPPPNLPIDERAQS